MRTRTPLLTPPSKSSDPPLDFDHLSRTPLGPSENSTTPPPEFSEDERPPPGPLSAPAIMFVDSSVDVLRAPGDVERLPLQNDAICGPF
jgi:hypothetical protein